MQAVIPTPPNWLKDHISWYLEMHSTRLASSSFWYVLVEVVMGWLLLRAGAMVSNHLYIHSPQHSVRQQIRTRHVLLKEYLSEWTNKWTVTSRTEKAVPSCFVASSHGILSLHFASSWSRNSGRAGPGVHLLWGRVAWRLSTHLNATPSSSRPHSAASLSLTFPTCSVREAMAPTSKELGIEWDHFYLKC